MVKFEDIIKLEDRELQKLLLEVKVADLVCALSIAPKYVRGKVFKVISKKAAYLLHEDIMETGVTGKEKIEKSQNAIVNIIKKIKEGKEEEFAAKTLSQEELDSLSKINDEIEEEILREINEIKKSLESSLDKPIDIINAMIYLSKKERANSILVLREDLEKVNNDFLKSGLELIISGIDPEIVSKILKERLTSFIKEEKMKKEMIMEGILAIQKGNNPEAVKKLLESFFLPNVTQ